MSTANKKLSALGPLTKLLVAAATVFVAGAMAAAPVRADEDPAGKQPNPFGSLGCGCQETSLTGTSYESERIDRGIADGSHLPSSSTPVTE